MSEEWGENVYVTNLGDALVVPELSRREHYILAMLAGASMSEFSSGAAADALIDHAVKLADQLLKRIDAEDGTTKP